MVRFQGRGRLLTLLVVLGILALPPVVLRAACIGNTCEGEGSSSAHVPFCSLPADLRTEIAAGYNEERSPDVLAVPADSQVVGWGAGLDPEQGGIAPPWPSTARGSPTEVPMVLSGSGIRHGVRLPAGTQLDAVAPTLLGVLGSKWAHPNVHEGTAIPHVASGGPPPRLVLLVAWKGVGTESLGANGYGSAPFLHGLAKQGASTLDADTGSVPVDPAAVLTTIGTGAPPSEHGITGTYLRNGKGALTRAWGAHAPLSIVAAIGDEYDHSQDERPMVGMVGTDPADLGLVGGAWYPGHDHDHDTTVRDPAKVPSAVGGMLADGFGKDDVPDILGVAMQGSVRAMDSQLRDIVGLAAKATGGNLTVAIAATGDAVLPSDSSHTSVAQVVGPVEDAAPGNVNIVQAAGPSGLFIDQKALAQAGVSSNTAVEALLGESDAKGEPQMADAFAGFAVQFGRYCSTALAATG
jgi:Type I phosphodiesterase / nucleotide pyrophosphatase